MKITRGTQKSFTIDHLRLGRDSITVRAPGSSKAAQRPFDERLDCVCPE